MLLGLRESCKFPTRYGDLRVDRSIYCLLLSAKKCVSSMASADLAMKIDAYWPSVSASVFRVAPDWSFRSKV
jgi:hypothetical protein